GDGVKQNGAAGSYEFWVWLPRKPTFEHSLHKFDLLLVYSRRKPAFRTGELGVADPSICQAVLDTAPRADLSTTEIDPRRSLSEMESVL
ncbi:MAG: hypothetical protein ACPL7K_00335, partial [Armatimonadota bacterium]